MFHVHWKTMCSLQSLDGVLYISQLKSVVKVSYIFTEVCFLFFCFPLSFGLVVLSLIGSRTLKFLTIIFTSCICGSGIKWIDIYIVTSSWLINTWIITKCTSPSLKKIILKFFFWYLYSYLLQFSFLFAWHIFFHLLLSIYAFLWI